MLSVSLCKSLRRFCKKKGVFSCKMHSMHSVLLTACCCIGQAHSSGKATAACVWKASWTFAKISC